jgi:hypothetical protein
VEEGHILTHASKGSRQDGLEFDPGTFDRIEVRSLPLLKWSSNANLILHGCNTAVDVLRNWSPAEEFAKRQKVRVLGQEGFAYFSKANEKYVRIPDMNRHSGNVFLWAYRRMRNDWTGDGIKIQGRIFTP